LDSATLAVLDKGAKNVEILKQGQYSPVSVEKQIAIIYCGTKALLRDIPTSKVKEFEAKYLEYLEIKHKDILKKLKDGVLNDDITHVLEEAATEVAFQFKK
jgi:F-type H+-transporting ATPase subunit alpha